MRNSTFVVCSFLGLIFLAASLIWFPKPGSEPVPAESDSKPEIAAEPSGGSGAAAAAADNSSKASMAKTADADSAKSAEVAAAGETKSAEESRTVEETKTAVKSVPRELQFLKWPKPAAAFVLTGEQHGYFEPCGCTANQLGGMTRRAGLFAKLRELGWDVRGIDLGGISKRTGPQAQIKFETTLDALRELKYVALGMGVEELRLGAGALVPLHITDGDEPMAFLNANLVFFGVKDLGTPVAKRIVELNGLKIGITSVMSDTIRKEAIADDSSETDITWSDPKEALTDVMKQFDDEGVTFRILLSQSTLEESRQLAKDFPAFNVIVAANGFGEGEPAPEMIGSVRMLQVGEKGKVAGVMAVYPDDKDNPVRFELITLNGEQFGDDPVMVEKMKVYQERLQNERIVTADNPVGYASGATFVGAAKCGECHTKAMAVWEKTPHAHALESLDPANNRDGHERLHGIVRKFDPECLACHVTGWDPKEYSRFRSGFLNAEFAENDDERKLEAMLAGNQCENCHGPGSRHVELIDAGQTEAAAKEVRVTLEQAKDVTCVKCHDVDNSPDYNFEKYWEEVKHPGRD